VNYFPKETSMNWVHGAMNRVRGHDRWGRSAPGHSGPSVFGFAAEILWIKGVCYGIISTVHPWAGDRDQVAAPDGGRHDVRSGARGGSSELSLALTPVAHSPWGLHLCDLRRTGIVTKVLTVIDEVGRQLAMRRQTQGMWESMWCTFRYEFKWFLHRFKN
jgi:hypothetical protein